jgi:asparagine N-glycosylation enzyme membrane subunit Stt3
MDGGGGYGHRITTIAKRISNSNPFQMEVAGQYGVAEVSTITKKSIAMEKLNHLGTSYAMTDYQMADGKFDAIATWNDSITQLAPYHYIFLQPNENSQLFEVQVCTPE